MKFWVYQNRKAVKCRAVLFVIERCSYIAGTFFVKCSQKFVQNTLLCDIKRTKIHNTLSTLTTNGEVLNDYLSSQHGYF